MNFNPSNTGATFGVILAPMVQAVLPSTFNGLTNVSISVATSAIPLQGAVNTTVVYFDNFQYATREICCT